MTTRVLFVRHGETDWNVAHRMQGHTDIPLNENGRAQAACGREYFASMKGEIAGFFSSDLLRASQTAEIIAEPHGMAVERDSRLREMNLGVFQTYDRTESEAKYPAEWASYGASRTFKIPGGESKVELYNRVAAGVEDIAAKFAGKTIIVVAHGGALRAIHARLQGVPAEVDPPDSESYLNAAVSEAVFDEGGKWSIVRWNDASHIKGVSTQSFSIDGK